MQMQMQLYVWTHQSIIFCRGTVKSQIKWQLKMQPQLTNTHVNDPLGIRLSFHLAWQFAICSNAAMQRESDCFMESRKHLCLKTPSPSSYLKNAYHGAMYSREMPFVYGKIRILQPMQCFCYRNRFLTLHLRFTFRNARSFACSCELHLMQSFPL